MTAAEFLSTAHAGAVTVDGESLAFRAYAHGALIAWGGES